MANGTRCTTRQYALYREWDSLLQSSTASEQRRFRAALTLRASTQPLLDPSRSFQILRTSGSRLARVHVAALPRLHRGFTPGVYTGVLASPGEHRPRAGSPPVPFRARNRPGRACLGHGNAPGITSVQHRLLSLAIINPRASPPLAALLSHAGQSQTQSPISPARLLCQGNIDSAAAGRPGVQPCRSSPARPGPALGQACLS